MARSIASDRTPMQEEHKIIEGLVSLMAGERPSASDVVISNLRQIRGGNSSEIWSFNATWEEIGGRVAQDLILRRGVANEFVSTGREAEFLLLKALNSTRVLAPRVLFFDADGHHLERPSMIMEHCRGVADRGLLTERNALTLSVGERVDLARQIVDALCEIHTVDTSSMYFDPRASEADPAVRQLDHYDEEILRLEAEPMPELRLASWWLRDNRPPAPSRRTIVHGDFRPANMLVVDGRLSTVLDWEFAHEGDPLEDLGWYAAPYYAHEHLVSGAWGVEDIIARYEQKMGTAVDRDALRFWSVFALYKLASMTVGALKWFMEGDVSRMTASARFILVPLLQSIKPIAKSYRTL